MTQKLDFQYSELYMFFKDASFSCCLFLETHGKSLSDFYPVKNLVCSFSEHGMKPQFAFCLREMKDESVMFFF